MASSFEIASLDELTELAVALFHNLLPDKNVGQNSDNWVRLRVVAGMVADLHAHLEVVANDIMADKAGEATIERIGNIYGVVRKGATGASGANAGRVRGIAGSSWSTSDTLLHPSGLRFRASSSGSIAALATEALVGIQAIDTGPATRLAAGDVLTWEVTPTGLENQVELAAPLTVGGEDKEEIGAYRTRILNRLAQPAMGGNANDWEQWALGSSAAIATAYVYPNRNGLGSVDVAALKPGSGTARLLDVAERTALLAYLDERRPVSAAARVLEVITQTQNVEVALVPRAGVQFSRDWDDTTPLVVASWTAGTRTLVFTTDCPPSMAVGHRVVVAGTAGVELEVESLSSTNAVVLVDAKGLTPAGAALVYSGGPLVAPARDAVLALFDSLGPRIGPFGFGDWEGSLLLSALSEAVQGPEGVRDAAFTTPSASVEPTAETYPDDVEVRLFVPGNIVVRYA